MSVANISVAKMPVAETSEAKMSEIKTNVNSVPCQLEAKTSVAKMTVDKMS